MKKLGILLLACITALNLWAEEEFKIGKLTFAIESPTTVGLTDADEDIRNVYLSDTIDYKGNSYTLTYIGEWAFSGCTSLTSVTIPNSVTSIEGYAFVGTALYNDPANWENGALYIDNCLIKVEEDFAGHFHIKENTRVISEYAFHDCSSLKSVTIPNSVTSIGEGAFGDCSSLTSVSIPSSVTSIGYYPFRDCSSLTSMVVASGNSTYDSRDNCNAIIETATNTLIAGCQNTTIPNSVTSIGEWAFEGCTSLTSVTIPNSVTSIGRSAFRGCSSLTFVTIPNSVTRIGSEAFGECTSLTSVTIPNSVTSIEWRAFSVCTSLTSVTIPNSVTSIEWRAFSGCTSLTSVTIPNSVTSIGGEAFVGTALYNDPANWENGALYIDNCLIELAEGFAGHFRIKENTRVIAGEAFYGCESLTSVTIPNSVTRIVEGAFGECTSLTSVTIPNSVTSIGGAAFADCTSLTSVRIPNSVTSIGGGAFYGCYSLTSVTIPNSVTSIGDWAFMDCSSLTSVTIPNSVTKIGYDAFPGHTKIIRQ